MKIFNELEKAKLKSALSQYAKDKCEHLPCDESLQNITFSDGFESKMTKVFKRQKTAVVYRAVALCACLALILGVIGFFARPSDIPNVIQPEIESEGNSDGLAVPIKDDPSDLARITKDVFIAKIVSAGKEIDDSDFGNIGSFSATPMIYKAKVISTVLSQTVTKSATIKIVHYATQEKIEGHFSNELKKGKKYLISGFAQPHGESAVIVDSGIYISQISKDKLTPISSVSQNYLKDISTLSEFVNSKNIKALCAMENNELPSAFDKYIIKKDDEIISIAEGLTTPQNYEYFVEALKDTIKVKGKNVFTKIECDDELALKLYHNPIDIFTVKIIEKVGVVDATDFTDIEDQNGTPMLYHVEVQESIWDRFIESKQVIKVVHFENENSLQVGKTYLLSGILQPYGNSVVFVDTGDFISEIDDGKFIHLSKMAQQNLGEIDTLADFKKCKTVLELNIYYRNEGMPKAFKKYGVEKAEDESLIFLNEHTRFNDFEYYVSILKQAIRVGSTATITKAEG